MQQDGGDDGSGGMGSPAMSLEGFFALQPNIPSEVKRLAEEQSRAALAAQIAEEEGYWARISSAVLMLDEGAVGDLSHVKQEFQGFANHWVRTGHGIDVISDFASFVKTRSDRFDRKQARKDKKARAQEVLRQAAAAAAAAAASRGAAAPPPGRRAAPAPPADMMLPVNVTMQFDPSVMLSILDMVEEPLGKIEGVVANVPVIERDDQRMIADAYTHMMAVFTEPRFKQLYGYTVNDHRQQQLNFGSDVPSYFANVTDQSIYRRKVLTMAGLRNLIQYGPTIYEQLKATAFNGNPAKYRDNTGLGLMRMKTGNVVDLDTVVLRCDGPTMNAINASNAHKKESYPKYRNADEFGKSQQAEDIAVHCAVPLLTDFAKLLNYTLEQQKARCIDPAAITRPIHVAQSNTDRGLHPIWHYINAGQNSFHVNVPSMDDVNGALLKAPLHCVRYWITLHLLFQGAERDKWIDSFFEDCIVDSCFNMKWKSIEEFGAKLQHHGSIVDVLQHVQADNQAIFTMTFFDLDDDEHTKEIAEMVRLTAGLSGREQATKRVRAITAADVAKWVLDPSVEI